MSQPCKSGQDCPEVLKAKAEMLKVFATALKEAVAPLLEEINTARRDMVKYAERMRYGAERFGSIEADIKELETDRNKFNTYIAAASGRKEVMADAATKSGRNAALWVSAATLILTGVGLYLTYRGIVSVSTLNG